MLAMKTAKVRSKGLHEASTRTQGRKDKELEFKISRRQGRIGSPHLLETPPVGYKGTNLPPSSSPTHSLPCGLIHGPLIPDKDLPSTRTVFPLPTQGANS
jgi:hypothetical protein